MMYIFIGQNGIVIGSLHYLKVGDMDLTHVCTITYMQKNVLSITIKHLCCQTRNDLLCFIMLTQSDEQRSGRGVFVNVRPCPAWWLGSYVARCGSPKLTTFPPLWLFQVLSYDRELWPVRGIYLAESQAEAFLIQPQNVVSLSATVFAGYWFRKHSEVLSWVLFFGLFC